MILYIKGPKHSTKKLPDTTNSFRRVAGYKINLQKSVSFLHTNNEHQERTQENNSIYNSLKKLNT
jgi:hypothetical protein